LARGVLGTNHVDARTRFTANVAGDAILRAQGGGRPSLTFRELVHAREVLVLGDDLQGEAPFAQAQIIRGQHQHGLHVTVAHPRRVKLARAKFRGAHLALTPGSEVALLNGLTRALLDLGTPDGLPAEAASGLDALRQSLGDWTTARAEAECGVPAAALHAAAKRLREAPT